MNPLEALQLQLRLEGFEIIHSNRLRQVDVVPDEAMPLALLARLSDGQVTVYFDESLTPNLYLELMERAQHIKFPTIHPLLEIFAEQDIPVHVGHYKTNVFPATFLEFVSEDVECRSKNDPQIQKFGFGDFAGQVYAIEREGRVVSACVSTHEDKWPGPAGGWRLGKGGALGRESSLLQ